MSDTKEKNTITSVAWFAIIAVLVIGGAGGFVAGFQVGKTNNTSSQGIPTVNGAGGPGGMMGMGAFGTVTAISESSITVKDDRTSTEQTYSITSSTKVTDNGETAALSDITTDDQVLVQTDSSSDDDAAATTIILNPSMGGPGLGARSTN